ncbi:MAG: (Fe-S)-binding protein [bacterium]
MNDKTTSTEELKAKDGWRKGAGKEQKRKYPFYAIEDPIEENRIPVFLETLKAVLKDRLYDMPLDVYLNTCAGCNSCATQCHLYLTTGAIEDLPAYRSNLLRRVYKRYATLPGRLFGSLVGAKELDEETIDRMIESFYRCTMCRRCGVECPMGVDNALLTRIGRCLLGVLNLAPKNFTVSTMEQIYGATGNTSSIPKIAFLDTLDFLEEEMKELTGQTVIYPRDKVGAEIFFIAPVSDYIMEADTLMGCAIALQTAGADWTIGTESYDAINYGLFYSDLATDKVLNKLLDEAHRLKVKRILIGECGHATKTAVLFTQIFGKNKFPVNNIMEYTANAIKQGKIKLNPEVNPDPVTYHDPCNLGRGLGIYDAPRDIIRAAVKNFVEMEPTREKNFCCGGGGGTVTVADMYNFRMKYAGIQKVEQVRKSGAKYLAAPCANCKKQLRELMEYHKVPTEVIGVHDLLIKATVFQ